MEKALIIVDQQPTKADPRRRPYRVPRRSGRAGNLQTLRIMATLVRRDVQDLGIRDFAARLVTNVPGHDEKTVADELFYFVRDRITYRRDPFGFEVIADTRKTLSLNYGDCGDKVECLATLWGSLGIKSRFVALSYQLPAFQHVYLEARIAGQWVPYDPTPEEAIPGWQSKGLARGTFPIYDGGDKSDPNNLSGLKEAGLGAGMGAAQGLAGGPIGAAIGAGVGFLSGLFGGGGGQTTEMIQTGAQFDAADKALADFGRSLNAKESITVAEYTQFVDGLNALATFAAQYGPQIPYVAKQWQMEQGNYAGAVDTLRAKVVGGGAAISAATSSADGASSSSSSSSSAGTVLLVGAGLFGGWWLFSKVAAG